MTSFICSLLFLSFTFSSFRLVDPTALKLRITNHALNALRDEAQAMFQEQVAGRTFEGFEFLNCKVNNVKLTEVNINQAHLQFVENYGFQFVIKNFGFTLNFDNIFTRFFQGKVPAAFVLTSMSATVEVGLIRNENGQLAADMRTCQASADRMKLVGSDLSSNLVAKARSILTFFISKLFCPVIRTSGLNFLNRKLSTIPMVAELFPNSGIKLDYSLSRDIQVTTTSLDMDFKGQAYRQPQPPPVVNDGVEPVFTEDAMMAYVGISEFFFNSAARCLYEAGFLHKSFNQINSKVAKAALRIKQFFTQPWNLRESFEAALVLTEAPTVRITRDDGFIFNMTVEVKVITSGTRTQVFSMSAVCPGSMMVVIEGNRLTLPTKELNCKFVTSNNLKKFMVKPLNKLLNNKATEFVSGWFGDGVVLPLAEVNFIEGNVRYENGYVVVGGDLRSTPAGRQKLADWARGPRR